MPDTHNLEMIRLIRAPRVPVFATFLDADTDRMARFTPNGPHGAPVHDPPRTAAQARSVEWTT